MRSIVLTIARKEFLEMVRDGRFRWAGGIVALLVLAALALGWQHHREQRRERQEAQSRNHRQWLEQGPRNPHSAAHFGVHAFRHSQQLSFVDRGLDPYLGTSVYLEAHYQNPFRHRPAQDATALQRFGELTAALVLQLLVPLLVILLTFGAVAGEREQGTLRQLLSLGLDGWRLGLGKALGVAWTLALLLVPATIAGVLALALGAESAEVAPSGRRFAALCLAYLLYFAGFLGLSLAVSAFARSARLALVLLLAFWMFNGLLAPRLLADLAERRHPTPTASQFWAVVKDDIAASGFDGHSPDRSKLEQFQADVMRRYGVSRLEDLPINFAGLQFQRGEEVGNEIFDRRYGELWATFLAQQRTLETGAPFAPLIAVRLASMGLAGTDLAHHHHFATAAEQHRRLLTRLMNEALAHNSRTGQWDYFADREIWQRVPELSYVAPDLGWAWRRSRWNLGVLAAWAAGGMALALFAIARLRAV